MNKFQRWSWYQDLVSPCFNTFQLFEKQKQTFVQQISYWKSFCHPGAYHFIICYVKQNTFHPFCNLPVNNSSTSFLSEINQKLLKHISKSESIVMRIKTEFYKEITPEITGEKIEKKAKEILNWLIWKCQILTLFATMKTPN